ncbi:hypothetical protein [Clostridium tarantellae]|uniref:Uncharacterized protein n=1 Tax=Clostridium tarantellae TaxID=39493 RepID=A0A6I1MRT5_9CLOT|nr:hypothetical protein [Clostridium tarantellae]MPQ43601.1 hypothetical protein [Clostridium tarantellae]
MFTNYNLNDGKNMPLNTLNISTEDTNIEEIIEYNKQISVFNNGDFNVEFLIIYKINEEDIILKSGIFNKGFTRYIGIPTNITSFYLTITIINSSSMEKLAFSNTVTFTEDVDFEVAGNFSDFNVYRKS